MKVSIKEVKTVLEEVLDKKISREEAANWALRLREAEDNDILEYVPKEFETLIWECILFIEGIDLKDSPDSYLHNDYDIQVFLEKM